MNKRNIIIWRNYNDWCKYKLFLNRAQTIVYQDEVYGGAYVAKCRREASCRIGNYTKNQNTDGDHDSPTFITITNHGLILIPPGKAYCS